MTEPNPAVSMNGDSAPVLSVACSLGHILTQGRDVRNLLRPLADRIEAFAGERGFSVEGLTGAISRNTLREIMEELGFSAEEIRTFDVRLHKMINRQECC